MRRGAVRRGSAQATEGSLEGFPTGDSSAVDGNDAAKCWPFEGLCAWAARSHTGAAAVARKGAQVATTPLSTLTLLAFFGRTKLCNARHFKVNLLWDAPSGRLFLLPGFAPNRYMQ